MQELVADICAYYNRNHKQFGKVEALVAQLAAYLQSTSTDRPATELAAAARSGGGHRPGGHRPAANGNRSRKIVRICPVCCKRNQEHFVRQCPLLLELHKQKGLTYPADGQQKGKAAAAAGGDDDDESPAEEAASNGDDEGDIAALFGPEHRMTGILRRRMS